MLRFILAAIFLISPASAAGWIEYRIGPFRVVSNAGDKAARERLTEMEQLRHVLGNMLGKDSLGVGGPGKTELTTIWPIDVVVFANAREYGPHALSKPFVDGGSSTLSAWSADTPMPRDWLRDLTRMLIDENAGRMPDAIETALCDLFSTIQVKATHVLIGAPLPPGELPADRLRAWATMQFFATNPEYNGKLRVYLNNLQGGGDEQMATRNAFGLTIAQRDAMLNDYVRVGKFEAAPASGEAMNPNRDFIEKPVAASSIDALMAELASAGKSFPSESPRGLLAKGTHPALELAAKANPRWGEPYFRMAPLETNTVAKILDLKTATKLEPRNVGYWLALAEVQTSADLYVEAGKSWAAAEKAAPDADKARIRQARIDMEERRAHFEASEKLRIADEKARELQRIKDAAAAEVHAAEDAANRKLGGFKSDKAPVEWWDDPQGDKVSGRLARVDCLSGPIRLTISIDGGGTIKLLIRDSKKLVVHGAGDATFGCGIQRPPRKIKVVFSVKADAKLGTVGEVAMVEFP